MWQKIKEFIIVPSDPVIEFTQAQKELIIAALAHYCAQCKTAFKTKGARNAHVAIKHKNDK